MQQLGQFVLILIAVLSVAIADVCIKKAAEIGTFPAVFFNWWMLAGIILYLLQIVLFAWMFLNGWNLSIVGSLQIVCYAAVVIGAGFFIFKEQITPLQLTGIILAFIGVLLTKLSIT